MGEFSGSFAGGDADQEVAAVDIGDSSTAFPSIMVDGATVDRHMMGCILDRSTPSENFGSPPGFASRATLR